ncbi:MAG: hypothetical protein AAB393_14055 [Bacteroidota bacterium]
MALLGLADAVELGEAGDADGNFVAHRRWEIEDGRLAQIGDRRWKIGDGR